MKVSGNISQLASWAGICPGSNVSAGKRKSSRIPKGNVYLKTALVEARSHLPHIFEINCQSASRRRAWRTESFRESLFPFSDTLRFGIIDRPVIANAEHATNGRRTVSRFGILAMFANENC